jgi:hypothetical protein
MNANMCPKMNGHFFKRSGILFTRPSFLEGFARILDLGGTLNTYRYDKNGNEADVNALCSDWSAVGDAIWYSIRQFAQDNDVNSEKEFLATG